MTRRRAMASKTKRVDQKVTQSYGDLRFFHQQHLTHWPQNKRKIQPKWLTCSDGDKVAITTTTLDEVRAALRKKQAPVPANRKYLVTVASPSNREEIYQHAEWAMQELEERILPAYGGRPWKVQVKITDDGRQSPYFRWRPNGTLELAAWPEMLDKIPPPPKFPGYSQKTRHEARGEIDTDSLTEEQVMILEMQERQQDALSTLAYEERWRVPLPTATLKWTSPLCQTFTTRKAAWDNAVQLCRNECLMDRVLTGYDSTGRPVKLVAPTKTAALKAGRLRFERDGLWVVGQEERWLLERMMLKEEAAVVRLENSSGRRPTALNYFLQSCRQEHRDKRLAELKEAAAKDTEAAAAAAAAMDAGANNKAASQPIAFTLRDAERELRVAWKQLKEEERQAWTKRFEAETNESAGVQAALDAAAESKPEAAPTTRVTPTSELDEPPATETLPVSTDVATASEGSAVASNVVTPSTTESTAADAPNAPALPPKSLNFNQSLATGAEDAKPAASAYKHLESTHWRLDDNQVKLCHKAGMDHFDQIMRTVQARDLLREFRDGFDLLRERGKGRFDMELPAFDEPQFDFLTSLKKAPWMPIVREILGKDVVLIHKGMFLSMPGSEPQDYHQDGVHLTTQYQKPCHAINVFVPLLDLTLDHGPTEFCLGSHILGQEDFEEEFLETPTVSAGTPIIFDYRLGHRGLGNVSSESRPVVYCTYARAADGKEFRDSVNFSRKRYHKIGDLVSKAPSREERAKKRELIYGDCWQELDESVTSGRSKKKRVGR